MSAKYWAFTAALAFTVIALVGVISLKAENIGQLSSINEALQMKIASLEAEHAAEVASEVQEALGKQQAAEKRLELSEKKAALANGKVSSLCREVKGAVSSRVYRTFLECQGAPN